MDLNLSDDYSNIKEINSKGANTLKAYIGKYKNNDVFIKAGIEEKEYEFSKKFEQIGVGVKIYDYIKDENLLVMEKMEGDLSEYIINKNTNIIEDDEFESNIKNIYNSLWDMLNILDENNLCYEDFHTDNLLYNIIDDKLIIKLTDFDIRYIIDNKCKDIESHNVIINNLLRINGINVEECLIQKLITKNKFTILVKYIRELINKYIEKYSLDGEKINNKIEKDLSFMKLLDINNELINNDEIIYIDIFNKISKIEELINSNDTAKINKFLRSPFDKRIQIPYLYLLKIINFFLLYIDKTDIQNVEDNNNKYIELLRKYYDNYKKLESMKNINTGGKIKKKSKKRKLIKNNKSKKKNKFRKNNI